MKLLLYIDPSIYNNIVYPFPIFLIDFGRWNYLIHPSIKEKLKYVVKEEDLICLDKLNYHMELIDHNLGERYGLVESINLIKDQLKKTYGNYKEIKDFESKEALGSFILYSYFRHFYLDRYMRLYPNLDKILIEQKGDFNNETIEALKKLEFLPFFFRRKFLLKHIKEVQRWYTNDEKYFIKFLKRVYAVRKSERNNDSGWIYGSGLPFLDSTKDG